MKGRRETSHFNPFKVTSLAPPPSRLTFFSFILFDVSIIHGAFFCENYASIDGKYMLRTIALDDTIFSLGPVHMQLYRNPPHWRQNALREERPGEVKKGLVKLFMKFQRQVSLRILVSIPFLYSLPSGWGARESPPGELLSPMCRWPFGRCLDEVPARCVHARRWT